MSTESSEFRAKAVILGAGALFALSTATLEVQPVASSPEATPTPRPLPTLTPVSRLIAPSAPAVSPVQELPGNKDGQARPVPTLAPQRPIPQKVSPPVQVTSPEVTPVPAKAEIETVNMETGMIFGPPYIPQKSTIILIAEAFQAGSGAMLQAVYGITAFGVGYATKKYIRP